MVEKIELRVSPLSPEVLGDTDFEDLGLGTWRIVVKRDDPFLERIARADSLSRLTLGKPLAWTVFSTRTYSKAELDRAPCLRVMFKSFSQEGGEFNGTEYDLTNACPRCGVGRSQLGPLRVSTKKFSKRADLVHLAGGELVCSARLVELIVKSDLTGASFGPVVSPAPRGRQITDWYQLFVTGDSLNVSSPSVVGHNPICLESGTDPQCAEHLLGIKLVSELYVEQPIAPLMDFAVTRQSFGVRLGMWIPERVFVVSPRARTVIASCRPRGFRYEVCHFVHSSHSK